MKPGLIIAISILAVSLSAQAATRSMKSCAAIDDPVERLSCYDTLTGRLPADTHKANIKVPDAVDPVTPGAEAVKPAVTSVEPKYDAEALFGLTEKQKPKEEKLDELQIRWTKRKKDGFGKWVITLENGQVWQQTDSRRFSFVDPEHRVVIYPGVLGSFFMGEPERKNGIRVKRIK